MQKLNAQLQQVSSKIHVGQDELRHLYEKVNELEEHLSNLRYEKQSLTEEINNLGYYVSGNCMLGKGGYWRRVGGCDGRHHLGEV